MAGGTIGITNLGLGQSSADELKSAAANVSVAKDAGQTALNPLTQVTPDLGSHFINELVSSLTDIYDFLNDLYAAADEYFQPEQSSSGIGGGTTYYGGGSSSGGDDSEEPSESITEAPETTPIETLPETVPETTIETSPEIALVQLDEVDTTELEELSVDDLYSVIDELVALAETNKTTLDELLNSDEYSEQIKQILLESPYISQEFKDIVVDMDSSVVRLLLKSILKGNYPEIFELNTLNLGIVYSILDSTSEEYGILINELLNNPKYVDILKDKLSSFGSTIEIIKGWEELSNEDFQEQLKSFYYGDVSEEFTDSDISTTRAYVDYLADACDVYYEDLILDSSYAETLKEGAVQFGKSLTFFNAQSFFSNDVMRENVSGMFDGTNYEAYGMTEDSIESFRKEIDSLASANNTKAERLLSDSQYADTVKDALLSSDSATGVGMIYKNVDSKVSQNVAKNLYNTSFDEISEEQMELDEILKSRVTVVQETKEVTDTTTETTKTEANASSGEEK